MGDFAFVALLDEHATLRRLVDTTPDQVGAFYPCILADQNVQPARTRGLRIRGLSVIDLLSRRSVIGLRRTAGKNREHHHC